MSNVAVIGASAKPDRYSHQAVATLLEYNHEVFPVSRNGEPLLGSKGYQDLAEIDEAIDTVTLYVSPRTSSFSEIIQACIAKQVNRVIFNPGTESAEHQELLEENGIRAQEACTLVLLRTGQFELSL